MSAGLRFEDLSPAAQAALLGEQKKSEATVSAQAEKKKVEEPSLLDRLGSRLSGPWPGLAAGFWFLLGWAALMMALSFLFNVIAIGYVLLAVLALGVATWKGLRGGKK